MFSKIWRFINSDPSTHIYPLFAGLLHALLMPYLIVAGVLLTSTTLEYLKILLAAIICGVLAWLMLWWAYYVFTNPHPRRTFYLLGFVREGYSGLYRWIGHILPKQARRANYP